MDEFLQIPIIHYLLNVVLTFIDLISLFLDDSLFVQLIVEAFPCPLRI